MNQLPLHIQKAIRTYKPIEADGITLFPIPVREYNEYLMARPALEVLHQSLPVAMLRIPLLAALYRMDYEATQNGEPITGLFASALMGLALALRLGQGQNPQKRIEQFQVVVDRDAPETLIGVRCVLGGEEIITITPAQYQTLRPIIAAQNGVRLESDMADPDLVQAEKDINEMNSPKLDAHLEDLISAVSALSGVDEEEIEDWPILKLERREQTYRRILDYLVCGIGQVNGTTWKGGNPTPHPFYARSKDGGLGAHVALDTFAGGRGKAAVDQQMAQQQSQD